MDKKRILTGDRPTGKLHIGHYFGSLQNRVKLQNEYETFIEVADVQALTDNFANPEKVKNNVKEIVIDSVTYGFLGYPVRQAADITAFDASIIPVGEDQLPLIEQCREIVRKFNSIYGETLKEPQAYLGKNKRIKGLDGNEKMGKSLGNAIFLSDTQEEITKKVMSAITDPSRIKKDDPGNPNICMVAYYHNLFSLDEIETICEECKKGKRGCVACKKQLIKNIVKQLAPIREKRDYYENRPKEVKEILMEGTNKAKIQASITMKKVKQAMKLDYFV